MFKDRGMETGECLKRKDPERLPFIPLSPFLCLKSSRVVGWLATATKDHKGGTKHGIADMLPILCALCILLWQRLRLGFAAA
jgi:hypothetical protein